MSLKRPFVPKSDVKQRFTTTTTEGRGGLNKVLNQPVAILYLVSYLAKSEWE